MRRVIDKLHRSNLLGRLMHTLDYCLQKELEGCDSVLDLGCGPSSPVQYCKEIERSVGVEIYEPYLEKAKKKKTHSEFLNEKIEDLDFEAGEFDAVVLTEVLEHLPEEAGNDVLEKAERWSRKKVILSTPNGFFPMGAVDGNDYQRHLSGWTVDDLQKKDYRVNGLGGLKFFYYSENKVHSLANEDEVFSNIRFRPKPLFYLLNGVIQIISHYTPRISFGLFAVKKKKNV